MLAKAIQVRAKYADNPLLQADTVKLFADGVLEGNPFAVPPTLPDSPSLKPFLQPVFGKDKSGRATVLRYVDTAAPACVGGARQCVEIRDAGRRCGVSKGERLSPGTVRGVERPVAARARRDARVREAIPHGGIQSAHPRHRPMLPCGRRSMRSRARGRPTASSPRAMLSRTCSWGIRTISCASGAITYTSPTPTVGPMSIRTYDMTVIPFIQPVEGNSYEALHVPGSYYESNAYPFRSSKEAGSILVAGSDAPVDTSDPRPFVNMSRAVTRRTSGRKGIEFRAGHFHSRRHRCLHHQRCAFSSVAIRKRVRSRTASRRISSC